MAAITHEIFVEGKRDKKFIKDLVIYLGFEIKRINFVDVGGWHEIKYLDNKIDKNYIEQPRKKSIIILDVDTNLESRREFLDEFKAERNLQFDYFLIPDNENIGNIETLLELIMRPDKSSNILDCFNNYYLCRNNAGLKPPQIKSKIYAYLDAYGKETANEKIDFLDTEMWDLDSPYLKPLKDFLSASLH